jgi:S-adenosylmethionine:tRNA ribosyltransferase-isomerase
VDTALFDYELPEGSIAQTPVEPRDAARLLRAESLEDRQFSELPDLLSSGDLLVVNRTRVRPARLHGFKRPSGGAVELLLTRRIDEARWQALIRPARRVRRGTMLECGPIRGQVLTDPLRGEVVVALTAESGDVEDVLSYAGELPLPPYIHEPLEDSRRYQTVFAKNIGSAAAPTAALHFTSQLVATLRERGIAIAEVDLEIGLDTFRPIAVDKITEHAMHSEKWSVPATTAAEVAATRKRRGRIVAVGTTVVRTLETAATESGLVDKGQGHTQLFITPGYQMKVVDMVLTNFHAPRTTLIVMIATLLGDRWRDVYAHAVAAGYRFLSFGDAMLIEKPVNHR